MPKPEKPAPSDLSDPTRAQQAQILEQLMDETSLLYSQEQCAIDKERVDALEAAIAALRAPSPVGELEAAQKAVRDACTMCDGHGYTIETGVESGHDCDGTDAMCSQRCPVAIPVEVQEPCEYCGRPIAAIQQLIDERLSALSLAQEK